MAVYFNNHCHRDVVIAFHDGVDLAKAYFVKYNDGMYLVTLVHSTLTVVVISQKCMQR